MSAACPECGEMFYDPSLARIHVCHDREITAENREAFYQGFVECALWADLDESETEDKHYSEFEVDDILADEWRTACNAFIDANGGNLLAYVDARITNDGSDGWDWAGHDLWLTSRGHGAGFWDRYELPETLRTALTDACPHWDGNSIWVADDGIVSGDGTFSTEPRKRG